MQDSSYQIGMLRDQWSGEDTSIFELCLDVAGSAKAIKASYNSPTATDVRFADLSISTPTALSYAIWHLYSRLTEETDVSARSSGGRAVGF